MASATTLDHSAGRSGPQHHRGAALIVSLIILLVMTVIGLTAMQGTVMEEKMAGNMRDKSIAFQAAEAALRHAEAVLSGTSLPTFTNSNGLYTYNISTDWLDIDWSDSTQVATYSGGTLSGVAAAPTYIIKEINTPTTGSLEGGGARVVEFYRITARAVGGTSGAVAMVQSIFKR